MTLDAQYAAFGRWVMDNSDVFESEDLFEAAQACGVLVPHIKFPLDRELTGAEYDAGVTGECDGEPCSADTAPGDTCYHRVKEG